MLPITFTAAFYQHIVRSVISVNLLRKVPPMFAYQPFPKTQIESFSSTAINNRILVAFDFDHTIVDDNTDTVARGLVPSDSLTSAEEVYKKTDSWTLYMGEIFRCLHKSNVSKKQIITAIHNIPPIKYMDSLLKHLNDNNIEVIVISDSNSVFINEWLKSYGLRSVVKKVVTNPAWFDDNDLLNVEFYQNQSFCKLSEPNLCKGYVLETYISDRKNEDVFFDHVIFIGDGSNDFCPTLKLSEKDLVFPRIGYPLYKKIFKNEDLVKAEIHPWNDGSDIINVFQNKFGLKIV